MQLIIGTIRLPPENLERARTAMQRMTMASRAEDGCLAYSYAQDVLEPGLIRVQELWRDSVALEKHWASVHFFEWRAQWPALGITDRQLMCYQLSRTADVS